MFRHSEITDTIVEAFEEEDEVDIQNKTFVNPAHVDLPSESVAFDLFAPCRDTYLINDQTSYWSEIDKFSEIEKVERL